MILRHNIIKIKRIKKLVLRLIVAAHHRTSLRQSTHNDYLIDVLSAGVFQQNRPIADLQVIPRERLNTPLERLVKRKDLTMGPLVKNEQAVGVLQE